MHGLLANVVSMSAIGLLLAVALGYGGGLFWFVDDAEQPDHELYRPASG